MSDDLGGPPVTGETGETGKTRATGGPPAVEGAGGSGPGGLLSRLRGQRGAGGPTAMQLYDTLVKDEITPVLFDLGFRGTDGRFHLPSTSHFALLDLWKSKYSDKKETRFTVNLCVVSKDVWRARSEAKPWLGDRPKTELLYGEWAIQTRIGAVLPVPSDKWWQIVPGQDLAFVRDDLLRDITSYGLPWLVGRVNAMPL